VGRRAAYIGNAGAARFLLRLCRDNSVPARRHEHWEVRMVEESTEPARRRRNPAPAAGDRNAENRSTNDESGSKTTTPSGENEGFIARVIRVATGRSEETDAGNPKATDMLRDDHDKVRALFKEYEGAGERAARTKKRIVEELTRELGVHAQIEEKIFYQAFRAVNDEDPKKIVRESFEEHKIVKTLLAELEPMAPSDDQFDAKVTVLKENVEHHADEEENDLFPAAEKLFGDEKLRDLGRQMTEMKRKLQRAAKSA
jgi:hemerythrin superfamily protein